MGEHGKDCCPTRSSSAGRRFALPGGLVAQIVRTQASPPPGLQSALHVCAHCRSELVQPLDWRGAGDDRWEVILRCPNCGWRHHGTFDGDELAEFEEHLDHGFDDLMRDLKRLRSANMTEEIERFASALEADFVLPEDF